MNKKYVSYGIITVLCLNLFPQKNSAFVLNEIKDNLIYESEEEKDAWETFYLPYAKHLKLVNKTTTMLDIAKDFEKEARDNPQGYTIVHKIMNRTYYERNKLIVKWERDNGYIAKEVEEERNITPIKRFQLLTEIEEEEEKEQKEKYNFGWKLCKTVLPTISFFGTFGVSKYKGISTTEATKLTSLIFMGLSMIVSLAEFGVEMAETKLKRLFADKYDEEIKLPPLRNMPVLPKDYKRVDVYRYGL